MKYLADTHILLWSLIETGKLSNDIKNILLNEENEIYYSPVSLWEISIKYGLKKLFLNGGTPEDLMNEIDNSFFLCKPVDSLTFSTCYKLPFYHKDPFDRFLIWEAIRSDLILISADDNLEPYKKDGLKLL